MDVVIRSRRASDAPFIEALARDAFAEYTPRSARHTLAMAQDPRARTFIAVRGDAQAGFAVLRAAPDGTAHLDAIAVDAAWRGHGIGRLLLRHAVVHARASGVTRLGLVTAEANLAALDLFLKEGFRVVRTMRDYYARGQTAHVLEKHLRD